jgi:hypothetical protein
MSGLPDEHLKDEPSRGVRGVPARPVSAGPAEAGCPPPVGVQLPRLAGAWVQGQVHCPYCLKLIETTLIGLSTLLGPSLLQCRRCERLLVSHRREWRDRSAAARWWYVLVSLV